MKRRGIAILLACMLLFTLGACGKPAEPAAAQSSTLNGETETIDRGTTTEAAGTSAPEESESATVPEDESSAGAEESATETTTGSDGEATTTLTTTAAVKAPVGGSAADIVKFYNTAANNTKAQKNFTAVRSNKLDCNMTEGFLSILNPVLNDLREDNPNVKEVFVNGKPTIDSSTSVNAFLPVKNQPYMSKLEVRALKSASCAKNSDGTFTVKLAFKEESFPALTGDGVLHHAAMDTLEVDWAGLPVTVNPETTARIHDATITAIVTADGQLLKELHIYEPVEVKGTVRIFGKLTVEGYWKQDIIFS
ncbi:MAG: hypothetical protein FWH26_04665 [Oscillospiraceae bacterium]|nr:hypothetical protein [Oscillospiraceae bacterium]